MDKPLFWIIGFGAILFIMVSNCAFAQSATVTCSSKDGERQSCPADTSAGIALQRSLGPGECLLGKTWGYDDKSVWVSDGCSGEFVLGQTAPTSTTATATPSTDNSQQAPRVQTWGAIESGKGFLVGRTD